MIHITTHVSAHAYGLSGILAETNYCTGSGAGPLSRRYPLVANASIGHFMNLLRRHRLEAGLSQADLAERAGLSARGISDLERGVNRTPQRETVLRLADALALIG